MIKEKPKFIVITTDGSHIDFCKVFDVVGYNEGLVLHYKPDKGLSNIVMVGLGYRPLEHKGIYYVGKQIGNNSVADLLLHRDNKEEKIPGNALATSIIGKPADPNAPGEDYSAIGRSNLYGMGIKAVYGKPAIPWNIIIIIAIIVIGLFIAVKTGYLHL